MKKLPGSIDNNCKLDSILRVNQAGEYGAKRIYLGQLAILKGDNDISKMLEQELLHLNYFNDQIKLRKVRPTLLQPLWHVGGFLLGATTALLGRKAAMACTVAVEEVIGQHYSDQLEILNDIEGETALKTTIDKFRKDELEHHEKGIEQGAEQTLGFHALKAIVKSITKAAIFASKRL